MILPILKKIPTGSIRQASGRFVMATAVRSRDIVVTGQGLAVLMLKLAVFLWIVLQGPN